MNAPLNTLPVSSQLAQALHDDLAQLLSLALIQLDQAAAMPARAPHACAQSRLLVKEALQSTRRLIAELRGGAPSRPAAAPIDQQCRQLAAEVSRLSLRPIALHCAPLIRQPPEAASALMLQAARELLLNACKHAPGADIRLSLAQTADGGVSLAVEDNGPGFAAAALAPTPDGLGLRALPGHLAQAGLKLRLSAEQNRGVRAEVRWRRRAPHQQPAPTGATA